MKFNFKSATKNIGTEAADLGLMIGGAVASKKFLDFSNLSFFKDAAAKDPKAWQAQAIKYQGGVKIIGGLVGRKYVKNKYVKSLLTGVAFEGGLNLLRQFTQKSDGSNYIDPIGQNDPKSIDNEMENGSMGNNDIDNEMQVGSMGQDDYSSYTEV